MLLVLLQKQREREKFFFLLAKAGSCAAVWLLLPLLFDKNVWFWCVNAKPFNFISGSTMLSKNIIEFPWWNLRITFMKSLTTNVNIGCWAQTCYTRKIFQAVSISPTNHLITLYLTMKTDNIICLFLRFIRFMMNADCCLCLIFFFFLRIIFLLNAGISSSGIISVFCLY